MHQYLSSGLLMARILDSDSTHYIPSCSRKSCYKRMWSWLSYLILVSCLQGNLNRKMDTFQHYALWQPLIFGTVQKTSILCIRIEYSEESHHLAPHCKGIIDIPYIVALWLITCQGFFFLKYLSQVNPI